MTNLHQLTSQSTTSCSTTWRSYRGHRLPWRIINNSASHFSFPLFPFRFCPDRQLCDLQAVTPFASSLVLNKLLSREIPIKNPGNLIIRFFRLRKMRFSCSLTPVLLHSTGSWKTGTQLFYHYGASGHVTVSCAIFRLDTWCGLEELFRPLAPSG